MDQTKKWLVTGAGEGLGRKLVETLLSEGVFVIGLCLDVADNRDLEKKYAATYRSFAFDLAKLDGIEEIVASAYKEAGEFDVVFSNAGYLLLGAAEEVNSFELEDMIDAYLKGSLIFLAANLPYLRKAGKGKLIQVTGENAFMAKEGKAIYSAVLHALDGYISALNEEMKPFGVSASTLEIGDMKTNFYGDSLRISMSKEAYEGSASHHLIDNLDSLPSSPLDLDAVVNAIIKATNKEELPLHILLGSKVYEAKMKYLEVSLKETKSQETSSSLGSEDENGKRKRAKKRVSSVAPSRSALFRPGRRKKS